MSARLPNAKANAILAYLALNDHDFATRERLAGLLWSESAEDRARASLRQCIKQLNTAFERLAFRGFQAARGAVALDRQAYRTDIDAVLAGGETATSASAGTKSTLDPRALLRGFEDLDPMFRSWLQVKRQTLHEELVRSLEARLADSEVPAAHHVAVAETLIAVDATHERAYRILIRDHAEKGNVAAAVRLYDRLWAILSEEHDVEPAPETQDLIVRIKSGDAPRAQDAAPPVQASPQTVAVSVFEPRIPTIGVAPFRTVGGSPALAPAIEGMRHELIAGLVRFREWVIVEADPDVGVGSTPANKHGRVDYMLEGSFLDAGNGYRMTITLKNRLTGQYVWSEHTDLTIDRWPNAQQLIARRLAIALNLSFSANRIADRLHAANEDAGVYDLWLRGQSLIAHWDPPSRARAEAYFREILQLSPNFAPAHWGLATVYNSRHIVEPGIPSTPDMVRTAADHATTAVVLDPLDTRSQLAFAWSNAMRGRYDQAEMHYGLSLDLNPNNPHTLMSAAQGLAFCGVYDRAREQARLSLELNPLSQGYMLVYAGCISFLAGDYEDCLNRLDRSGGAILTASGFRAAALSHLDRPEEAAAEASVFVDAVRSKWMGPEEPSDGDVVSWFLDNFPIRDPNAAAGLREGLRGAGLPAA